MWHRKQQQSNRNPTHTKRHIDQAKEWDVRIKLSLFHSAGFVQYFCRKMWWYFGAMLYTLFIPFYTFRFIATCLIKFDNKSREWFRCQRTHIHNNEWVSEWVNEWVIEWVNESRAEASVLTITNNTPVKMLLCMKTALNRPTATIAMVLINQKAHHESQTCRALNLL